MATLTLAVFLSGCGGSGSVSSTSRFTGNYTGSFAGVTAQGFPVGGTLWGTADRQGNFIGSFLQDGETHPAQGTVNSNGSVVFSATGAMGDIPFSTTMTGTAQIGTGSVATIQGNFSTSQYGVNNAVTGRFTAIRAQNTPNRFLGNYDGTFQGTTVEMSLPVNGTFAAQVDNNGALFGTVTQSGVGTTNGTGFVRPNGQLFITAVGPDFTSDLTGTATISGGSATTSGSFTSTRNGATIVTGTFAGMRTNN